MELDNLKSIWQGHIAATIKSKSLNIKEIQQLAKGKADTALSRFSRSILLDVGFLLGFLLVGVVAAFYYQQFIITAIVVVVLLVALPFFIIFFKQYFFIKNITLPTQHLYQNLSDIIEHLDNYVRHYFRAVMLFTVAAVPIVALIALYQPSEMAYNPFVTMAKDNLQVFVFLYTLAMIALVAANYFFTRWYLQNMYGNYINTLKTCLKELDDLVMLS